LRRRADAFYTQVVVHDSFDDIRASLIRLGIMRHDMIVAAEPLTGGVSSDIWKVTLPDRVICVKRALARLKVAKDWRAPVERNSFEVAWMRRVAAIRSDFTPPLLAVDDDAKLFVMAYLDPREHVLWKSALRDGTAKVETSAAVGDALARIHAATADDRDVAAAFPTDAIFHAIRLEPYLEATARHHPDLADRILAIVARTAATKRALVHGDVSPKNILVGPCGPVFLDAECAWYGDPAFDIAFCLNHLLQKTVWRPGQAAFFRHCFETLAERYLTGATWEDRAALEARIAALLPALFLARVDGKSPVEYITGDSDRDKVRRVARRLIIAAPTRLGAIRDAWANEVSSWH
jgi:aminoglycoside phosphotransferase (APT) family kinase protein